VLMDASERRMTNTGDGQAKLCFSVCGEVSSFANLIASVPRPSHIRRCSLHLIVWGPSAHRFLALLLVVVLQAMDILLVVPYWKVKYKVYSKQGLNSNYAWTCMIMPVLFEFSSARWCRCDTDCAWALAAQR
jgi:hypothetical protein